MDVFIVKLICLYSFNIKKRCFLLLVMFFYGGFFGYLGLIIVLGV